MSEKTLPDLFWQEYRDEEITQSPTIVDGSIAFGLIDLDLATAWNPPGHRVTLMPPLSGVIGWEALLGEPETPPPLDYLKITRDLVIGV